MTTEKSVDPVQAVLRIRKDFVPGPDLAMIFESPDPILLFFKFKRDKKHTLSSKLVKKKNQSTGITSCHLL